MYNECAGDPDSLVPYLVPWVGMCWARYSCFQSVVPQGMPKQGIHCNPLMVLRFDKLVIAQISKSLM